jgi:hypothetical protein
VKKLLPALLFLLASSCLWFQHAPVTDNLSVVRYNAIPEYQIWANDALRCAQLLKLRNPELPFAVIHDSVDVQSFVWYAVATESTDGSFPCQHPFRCVGLSSGDTVLISSWHVGRSWVVKHEMMHWFVESATEMQASHGLPWGMCEGPISGN